MTKMKRYRKPKKSGAPVAATKKYSATVSTGFKRRFSSTERDEIMEKRRKMHERLYAKDNLSNPSRGGWKAG